MAGRQLWTLNEFIQVKYSELCLAGISPQYTIACLEDDLIYAQVVIIYKPMVLKVLTPEQTA